MRRPEFIARQSARPSGVLGRLVAWIMERETTPDNDAVVARLAVRPTDAVLEVGFGHGRTLELVAGQLSGGFLAGIDPSSAMVAQTSARCRRQIAAGLVQLELGTVEALPFPDGRFDVVYSVHTLYFWPNAAAGLCEIARVLRPRGRLLLAYRPKSDPLVAQFPATVYRFHTLDEVTRLLLESGYEDVRSEDLTLPTGPLVVTSARRP